MTIFYSESTNGFYDSKIRSVYEASNSWPQDATELSEDEFNTYWRKSAPDGYNLRPTNGRPSWVELPPKTFEQELDELNAKYDSDFNALVKEYNRAVARDGVPEGVKVSAVRAKMVTLDNEYDDAVMALTINQS